MPDKYPSRQETGASDASKTGEQPRSWLQALRLRIASVFTKKEQYSSVPTGDADSVDSSDKKKSPLKALLPWSVLGLSGLLAAGTSLFWLPVTPLYQLQVLSALGIQLGALGTIYATLAIVMVASLVAYEVVRRQHPQEQAEASDEETDQEQALTLKDRLVKAVILTGPLLILAAIATALFLPAMPFNLVATLGTLPALAQWFILAGSMALLATMIGFGARKAVELVARYGSITEAARYVNFVVEFRARELKASVQPLLGKVAALLKQVGHRVKNATASIAKAVSLPATQLLKSIAHGATHRSRGNVVRLMGIALASAFLLGTIVTWLPLAAVHQFAFLSQLGLAVTPQLHLAITAAIAAVAALAVHELSRELLADRDQGRALKQASSEDGYETDDVISGLPRSQQSKAPNATSLSMIVAGAAVTAGLVAAAIFAPHAFASITSLPALAQWGMIAAAVAITVGYSSVTSLVMADKAPAPQQACDLIREKAGRAVSATNQHIRKFGRLFSHDDAEKTRGEPGAGSREEAGAAADTSWTAAASFAPGAGEGDAI